MKLITKTKQLALLLFTILFAFSCNDDDDSSTPADPFVVAFQSLSFNLTTFDSETTVALSYSEPAEQTGTITITLSETNATYGVDYTTTPAAVNNQITLDITEQTDNSINLPQNSFVFNKINATIDEEASIEFRITEINYPNGTIQGNDTSVFNSSASLGGSLVATTGGPNEQNQVFVDLSNNKATSALRDSWDLGFNGGDEFRVSINGSIYMFAAALTATDIDAVTSSDTEIVDLQPQMNIGQVGAELFADNVEGDINSTAIAEISETDSDNNVYLINMGYEVGTETPEIGSVDISDNQRGWKKIRILRSGNDYLLQYADLDDTSHQEVTISKNSTYNFTHFSLVNEQIVDVQPEKDKWDIGFTVFTNIIAFGPLPGAYGFSDFVITNRNGNTSSYSVESDISTYEEFSISDVESNNFEIRQNTIGSGWRSVFSGTVTQDIFYVIKDSSDNIYKLKFLALTDDTGVRGYPEFEFELLQ